MSKSIIKNSVFFFLLLNAFLSIPSFGQTNIVGKWETKGIIGYTDVQEYSLIRPKDSDYGSSVTFNLDGTFSSGESIQCLNGCSAFTSGTYTLIDNDHIRIIVEDVRFVGFMCGMNKTNKKELIRDLGVFYVYKERADAFRLIPSKGNLQQDRDEMLYTQLLNSFDKEWKSYDYEWETTNSDLPEEIVKDYFDQRKTIGQSTHKIVFSKNQSFGKVFLLKKNEAFYYVVYNEYDKKVSLAYPKDIN